MANLVKLNVATSSCNIKNEPESVAKLSSARGVNVVKCLYCAEAKADHRI